MQKWIQPSACLDHGLHRILSFYWLAHCYLMRNPPKCSSFLFWIAEWCNSLLLSRNPKDNWNLSRIFGARFGEKDRGLSTCKPWSEQAGGLEVFLHEASQNFEVISNIQNKNQKIKNLKRFMSFSRLSNATTLMQIQSGRKVPLKGQCHEMNIFLKV